jgi:hypothetical protein
MTTPAQVATVALGLDSAFKAGVSHFSGSPVLAATWAKFSRQFADELPVPALHLLTFDPIFEEWTGNSLDFRKAGWVCWVVAYLMPTGSARRIASRADGAPPLQPDTKVSAGLTKSGYVGFSDIREQHPDLDERELQALQKQLQYYVRHHPGSVKALDIGRARYLYPVDEVEQRIKKIITKRPLR